MESQYSLMAGEHAGLGTELAAAPSTDDHDTFVSLMQTIRSDVFQALQFIEQQHPRPAKAEATAKTVAWLKKNNHQLQRVIRNLAATSENEPTPTAQSAIIDVIHVHSSLRPIKRGSHRRRALCWRDSVPCFVPRRCVFRGFRVIALCTMRSAFPTGSSAAKANVSRSKWRRSCALHTVPCRPHRRGLGSCGY